jgi:hypothetical protein
MWGLAVDMSTPLKKLSPWQAWQERWAQEGLWRSESQDGQWSEAYKLRRQFRYCTERPWACDSPIEIKISGLVTPAQAGVHVSPTNGFPLSRE